MHRPSSLSHTSLTAYPAPASTRTASYNARGSTLRAFTPSPTASAASAARSRTRTGARARRGCSTSACELRSLDCSIHTDEG